MRRRSNQPELPVVQVLNERIEMIAPHGADTLDPRYVKDSELRAGLRAEAETLPSVVVSSAAAGCIVMLGGGYFTPLPGFMNLDDALGVARHMQTTDGVFWPVPVLNLLQDADRFRPGDRIALRDPNVAGNPVLAIMDVDDVERLAQTQVDEITALVFGTQDGGHPGVADFRSQGRFCVSGQIQVLGYSYFASEFPKTFRTAVEIREEIRKLGWRRTVAFQTRNPMHLAHEELCRMAMAQTGADGIVIHMLLGKLKPGDIPAAVRDACIRKMVEVYFPDNSVLVTGYGFDMMYAGPREAVLHAIFRQNMGATHFIVGRDHAGVGDFYGPFDAQEIFETEVPEGALGIEVFAADHTAWSRKLNRVVMMRDATDHRAEDFILLSGTRLRELLGQGISPPEEFTRPEVARILMDHYRTETGGQA